MNLFNRFYFVIFILFFSLQVYSQDPSVLDSLILRLEQEEQDTVKTDLYFDVINYLLRSDADSAKYYANKGLFFAKKNNLLNETGNFYSTLGDIYVFKNDLSQALDNYLSSIEIYNTTKNIAGKSNVYLNMGNIYLTQANFSTSLKYYYKGLKIADSLHLKRLLPHFYNNLGELYSDLENYDKAIENYKKALEYQLDGHNFIGAASIYNNICQVYIKMGNVDKAQEYLDQAYNIYDSISDEQGLYNIFITRGNIEEISGNYEQALMNYFEADKYLKKIGEKYFGPKSLLYAENYYHLGHSYLQLHDYRNAQEYLTKAFNNAREIGLIELLTKSTLDMSELYEKTNKPVKALNYYKLYKEYYDSISIAENQRTITQLEMQHEFDELLKQKEIESIKFKEQQKRKESLYMLIIGGIAALLIVLGLLFNTQRLKKKNLNLEKEKLGRELEYKNKELTTNVLYLLKKNEFVLNILNQLKSLRYSIKPENRKIIDSIIRQMEQSTSKDVWKEFEIRFQDVHSEFYNKLIKKYPDLTPNELKLCAFLRLNMSTKEISSITFQSYNSIIMARHRLRKKLDISSNENLIAYLRQL